MDNTTDNKETKKCTADDGAVYSGCGCSNPNTFADTMKSGFDKVFGGMKSACVALIAILTAVVMIGCKTVPTVEKMQTTSHAVGVAAGMVANMTRIDDTSRNAVIDIMNTVDKCVPGTNETFTAAWTPIAKEKVQKLLDEKKIDEGQSELILGAFAVAVKGVDYLIDVRFPKVRDYQNLLEAATHGFNSGFLTVFKPANTTTVSAGADKPEYDVEAFEYLMTHR